MILALVALVGQPVTKQDPLPVVPVIGTTLSWDSYGMYPLDAEEVLTRPSREIVQDLIKAERGRAESLARYRLRVDKDDLVPAWALAQIVRAKGKGAATAEYQANVRPFVDRPASLPLTLYRYEICGAAEGELMSSHGRDRQAYSARYAELDTVIKTLRARCRPADRLGVAAILVRSPALWDVSYRAILLEYQKVAPEGVDVRPLLCRNYLAGFITVGIPLREALKDHDAPEPKRVLEIAGSMLKDRPGDPLGLYYRGRAYWVLEDAKSAIRDVAAAARTNRLPPVLERCAEAFLRRPSEAAFNPSPSVY